MTTERVLTDEWVSETAHGCVKGGESVGSLIRKVEAAVLAKVAPRPTDDALWDQTLRERDRYHEIADLLADLVVTITGAEIGEHSSANSPWDNAIAAAEEWIDDAPRREDAVLAKVAERSEGMYAKGAYMAAAMLVRYWGQTTMAGEIIRSLPDDCEKHAEQFDAEALAPAFPAFAALAATKESGNG